MWTFRKSESSTPISSAFSAIPRFVWCRRTFGSVAGITAALDAGHGGFPRGSRDKLEKARSYLDIAMSVVRVADDAPLPPVDGQLPAVPPDADKLKEFGERWGLGSSLSRFLGAVCQT